MENFLNFMKSIIDVAKKDAEAPIVICFCKESGLNGKRSTTVKGPDAAIFASLCELVPAAIKKIPDKDMQRITLALLYEESMRELGFSEE